MESTVKAAIGNEIVAIADEPGILTNLTIRPPKGMTSEELKQYQLLVHDSSLENALNGKSLIPLLAPNLGALKASAINCKLPVTDGLVARVVWVEGGYPHFDLPVPELDFEFTYLHN